MKGKIIKDAVTFSILKVTASFFDWLYSELNIIEEKC